MRRAPRAGIGNTRSSKRLPRCHSSSAGSRHGPGTQMISSRGLGVFGAAFWIQIQDEDEDYYSPRALGLSTRVWRHIGTSLLFAIAGTSILFPSLLA